MKKTKSTTKVEPTKQSIKGKPSISAKKKNRRSADPLNALKKEFTLKSRADLIDFDYLDKLNLEEKLWLAQFAKEEIHAAVDGKVPTRNKFNKTKAKTRKIFHSNNARNRCTWTRERAKGMAEYLEDHKETLLSNNPEAFLAVKMDLEKDGWVNNNGDVIKTEEEVIEMYKLEEKLKKLEAKKAKLVETLDTKKK